MNHKHLLALGIVACVICVGLSASVNADDKPAQKEHAQAEADHGKWLKELQGMKVEHRRALAALKRLEAEILEHEAELEEQIAEIEDHRRHIHAHEAAISEGEGKEAEKAHQEIEKRHAMIAKAMKSAHQDHKDLISGLMKFVKEHVEKFHDHDHDKE